MKIQGNQFPLFSTFILLFTLPYHIHVKSELKNDHPKRKTYIVHMDKSHMPTSFTNHHEWYYSSLKSASNSAELLYAYNSVIHGFSTALTDEEARSLERQPEILSLIPEARYELHTTRTPEFLGLGVDDHLFPDNTSQGDVVIGVVDTGVWPDAKSFNDVELGPVRASWKGGCMEGTNFKSTSCNRKLVGARFFCKGYEAILGPIDESMESKSPRDDNGHGTHTASTLAGSAVSRASLFGYASGTARGMAPLARIAVYKACWLGGCFTSDILAAMDAAIDDEVDVLSMSIGGSISEYYQDTVAVGAFAAMKKGILVSCSAGNAGPDSGSLSNVAPWITTVGAGTIDRDFPAHVILGDGRNFTGASLYSGKSLTKRLFPLVYAGASNMTGSNFCMSGSLTPRDVSGKIVVCDRGGNSRVQKGLVVKKAGGVGMILANTGSYGEELVADPHLIPAASLGQREADEVKKYISTGEKPKATIGFSGTEIGVKPSPVVASFSSRGPNPLTPEILKPDLIAPGVNILAGWTDKVGPSELESDTRHVEFNIISGTSMSCPHVSGLAALVKAAHPEWTPAAIKSALMTTAYTAYTNTKPIIDVSTGLAATPFDYGAGHVNPIAALDPGLVYDSTVDDYLDFLCALNYSSKQIKHIANQDYMCSSGKNYSVRDLNYPSFAVSLDTSIENVDSKKMHTVEFRRTVTNVGKPATYRASVSVHTTSVKVAVEPESLSFDKVNEKKSFKVVIQAKSMASGEISFAHLIWSDGKHNVTSPITFSWT